ncbi:hypothetical protein GUJ93_ZPchr0004g38734 [Zizania palustris]|uniref:Uncharacterized protein n=1 Tax=Zizania palustris TaxID=103762 RepID=A0A8J5S745_ZIZPA|nr:hypothetical protein GUJ93_ZPchr0004g38734 [Zizania palustris]
MPSPLQSPPLLAPAAAAALAGSRCSRRPRWLPLQSPPSLALVDPRCSRRPRGKGELSAGVSAQQRQRQICSVVVAKACG